LLCVNCDQPLPDGADACPSCGAHRLELLVSPASEASLKPRRRHRGLAVVGLLLCVAVVAALAGQAYLSHSGGSDNPSPPKAKAKAKAPAKAPPAKTATKSSGTGTSEPPAKPQPTVVHVYLGRVPRSAPDPDAAVAAVQAAMRQWASQGLDLRQVDDGDDADVGVRFVADAADAGSQSGLAVVPLGDDGCGGAWAPYTQRSVQALAARALGEAMGRDGPAGPGQLMDPNLKPEREGCVSTHGALDLASGQSDGKPFRLESTAGVSYTMQASQGYADVCLLTTQEWDAFAAGEGGGAACHYSSQQESDSATLEPGDYILGFRCVEAGLACHVEYTLSASAA
jgi:hypothetical protein